MREVFKYIKASTFFPKYCPEIKNWRHKMRGKSGKGEDIAFSIQEITQIKNGIEAMSDDLKFTIIFS